MPDNNGNAASTVLLDPFMAARLGEAARAVRGDGDMEIIIPDEPKRRVRVKKRDEAVAAAPTETTFVVRLAPDKMLGARKPTRVTVQYDDDHTVELLPDQADCFFWGEAACEKFLWPYYASQYGVEYAYEMRKEYMDRSYTGVCHLPGSELCDPTKKVATVGALLTAAAAALR